MRVVAAFPSPEGRRGIAGTGAFGFILGPETVHRRPRFNQRSVHAEVFVEDPIAISWQFNHGGEEQVHEPAEHQAGLRPRAELPIGAHRVEGLQNFVFEQRLGRDRERAVSGIDFCRKPCPSRRAPARAAV